MQMKYHIRGIHYSFSVFLFREEALQMQRDRMMFCYS